MAKTLKTRIKNRYDSLANWSVEGVELLQGEIALVKVDTQQIDKDTGDVVTVPAFLMKVGENDTNGNPKAFSALPWMSAIAADVYDWAKNPTAEEIPFVMTDGDTATSGKTLRQLLELINGRATTNTTDIAANTAAITVLNKGDNDTGSVANTAISKVTAALNALDLTDAQATGEGTFVKTVTQTNGQIAVVKAKIEASDLPEITTSMIKPGDASFATLEAKLDDMDSKISANTSKLTGHTDAAINTLIDNKINALDGGTDSGSAGTGKYVSQVVQTNGKVATTYTSFPAAGAEEAGIVKLGATGGAATYDSIFGTNGLESDVKQNAADIVALTNTVSRGVNFRGEVSAAPTGSTYTLNGESTAKTALIGDIVIFGEKEYIYTAEGTWKELGDLSRVGAVEDLLSSLPETSRTANQYVTHIAKENGKLVAKKACPLAAEIQYASGNTTDTVYSKIEANAAAIATKADAEHDHTEYENQNAFSNIKVGNTTVAADIAVDTVEFIGSNVTITPDATNDKITFTVADGATNTAGIVKLSDATDGTANAASGKTAATPAAVKAAYAKAVEAAADAASRAPGDHSHGNITKDGTITSTTVTAATGVLVYDSNNKIQRTTVTNARTILEVSKSDHTHDTRYVRFDINSQGLTDAQKSDARTNIAAAASNHTHSAYEADISAINANYIRVGTGDKLVQYVSGTETEIIFDCGGAPTV